MVVGGNDGSSKAIERAGFGPWSHMANVLCDGQILDARSDVIAGVPPGVQIRPKGYLDSEPRWAIFEAPSDAHYSEWASAGLSQLKKPYDIRGIEDFAIGTFTGSYSDPDYASDKSKAWFCDELAGWMAIESGDIPPPPPWFQLFANTPTAGLNLFIGAGWEMVQCKGI